MTPERTTAPSIERTEPFTCRFDFCFTATDMEAAGERETVLIEAAEAVGFYFQGGSTDAMDRKDVIPDSPLDKDLNRNPEVQVGQVYEDRGNGDRLEVVRIEGPNRIAVRWVDGRSRSRPNAVHSDFIENWLTLVKEAPE